MNRECPDVQTEFRKGRGTRDQIANIHWIIAKARALQKTFTYALLTTPKPLTVWITKKLWKILQEMGTPDHLICLLRNLYAGQEATKVDMEPWTGSKFGKEYHKAVYCHSAYLISIKNTSCKMLGTS